MYVPVKHEHQQLDEEFVMQKKKEKKKECVMQLKLIWGKGVVLFPNRKLLS